MCILNESQKKTMALAIGDLGRVPCANLENCGNCLLSPIGSENSWKEWEKNTPIEEFDPATA